MTIGLWHHENSYHYLSLEILTGNNGDENFRLHVLFSMRSTFKGGKRKEGQSNLACQKAEVFDRNNLSYFCVVILAALGEKSIYSDD